jgi:ribosome-associated protein
MIHVTDIIVFDEHEIHERFVRTAGPGGANIDRDAIGVELRVDIAASSLPEDVKKRLVAIAGRQVTSAGELVVVARADRSQPQNRAAAHARLLRLLERAATSPTPRRPTTPTSASRRLRVEAKERRSAVKRSRRRRDNDS